MHPQRLLFCAAACTILFFGSAPIRMTAADSTSFPANGQAHFRDDTLWVPVVRPTADEAADSLTTYVANVIFNDASQLGGTLWLGAGKSSLGLSLDLGVRVVNLGISIGTPDLTTALKDGSKRVLTASLYGFYDITSWAAPYASAGYNLQQIEGEGSIWKKAVSLGSGIHLELFDNLVVGAGYNSLSGWGGHLGMQW